MTEDPSEVNKHLPGAPQSTKILKKEAIHVFNSPEVKDEVVRQIMEHGQYTRNVREWNRYDLYFDKPIRYRGSAGKRTPLHYGDLKVKAGIIMQIQGIIQQQSDD